MVSERMVYVYPCLFTPSKMQQRNKLNNIYTIIIRFLTKQTEIVFSNTWTDKFLNIHIGYLASPLCLFLSRRVIWVHPFLVLSPLDFPKVLRGLLPASRSVFACIVCIFLAPSSAFEVRLVGKSSVNRDLCNIA